MNPSRFRGFGPSDPKLLSLLQECKGFHATCHQRTTPAFAAANDDDDDDEDEDEDASSSASTEAMAVARIHTPLRYPSLGSDSFLNFDLRPMAAFDALRALYEAKTEAVRHEFDLAAGSYGSSRLDEILPKSGADKREQEREVLKKRKNRLADLRKKRRQQQLCDTDSDEEEAAGI